MGSEGSDHMVLFPQCGAFKSIISRTLRKDYVIEIIGRGGYDYKYIVLFAHEFRVSLAYTYRVVFLPRGGRALRNHWRRFRGPSWLIELFTKKLANDVDEPWALLYINH